MKSKILINGLIVAGTLMFSGCVKENFQQSVYHDNMLKTGKQEIKSPELNIINTVEIGENLYLKSYLLYNDTYDVKLSKDISFQDGYYWINTALSPLKSSSPYQYSDSQLLRKVYENEDDSKKHNAICYTSNICLVDFNNTGKMTYASGFSLINYKKLSEEVAYKKNQTILFAEESYKYDVLYQGKIGNKIKISFREFKDDMARPAFTQDIEYELEKDGTTIIGFKGLRIEVLKATNTDITYKVTKDYH